MTSSPDSDLIALRVDRSDALTVVAVDGVVDLLTAPDFQAVIDELIDQGLTHLIVDLSGVEFMASVGLTILAGTAERLRDGQRFAVVANNPPTLRPIVLTGLDQVLSLYSSLTEAREHLGADPPG